MNEYNLTNNEYDGEVEVNSVRLITISIGQ